MMLTASKTLRLALIGMSGAAKTYWARHLAEQYPAISTDDQIEARLAPELQKGDFRGINGVAAWMGWPDSPTYAERESHYLAEEIASMDEVLTGLEKNPASELILDTSGSVIHVGNNLLLRLRKLMTVVYLEASAEEQQLLIRRYLDDPKPVLWRGAFQPRARESATETVARCYPALIGARRQSYQALAHHTLPVAELRELAALAESRGQSPAAAFLDRLRSQIDGRRQGSSI
jgi:shikimate kinase